MMCKNYTIKILYFCRRKIRVKVWAKKDILYMIIGGQR